MLRKRLAAFVLALVVGFSIVLVGCGSGGKGTFDAYGYQGKLEDGFDMVYIMVGEDSLMVSLTDEQHQGDTALTYSGKPATDADGKITVADEDSGESITLAITENDDGTASVDVEGHGKGTLKKYEGNVFDVIGSMAEDDSE